VKAKVYRKRAKKKMKSSYVKSSSSYHKPIAGNKSKNSKVASSRGFNKGIMPVQVNVRELEIGTEFKFKDVLLPAHQFWTGEVRYRKVDRKGCCSKRRIYSCTIL